MITRSYIGTWERRTRGALVYLVVKVPWCIGAERAIDGREEKLKSPREMFGVHAQLSKSALFRLVRENLPSKTLRCKPSKG